MHAASRPATPRAALRFGALAAALICLAGLESRAEETLTNSALALVKLESQEGGTLRLAFDGAIALRRTILITTNTTVDASGHDVTLDGGQSLPHLAVTNGAVLRLVSLQLVQGRALGAGAQAGANETAARGGSIYNWGGTLELAGCTFSDNQAVGANAGAADPGLPGSLEPGPRGGAAYGGAIYSIGGELFLTNCTFENNGAFGGRGEASGSGYTGGGGDAYGGAVYCTNSRSSLDGVVFKSNLARAGEMSAGRALEGGGGAYGGAVAGEGELMSILGCSFSGNQAVAGTRVASDASRDTGLALGGALFHGGGSALIDRTAFEGNSSRGGPGAERGGRQIVFGDGKGGAVYSRGELELRNSAVISNTASGGDVPADCCSPFIAQAGAGEGGGIANAGLALVHNSTFAQNSALGGKALSPGVFSGPASGGALAVSTGAVSLLNITLSANRVEASSARRALGGSIAVVSGTVACTNTILSCPPGQTNVSGAILDGGHNICSDGSAAFTLPSSRNNVDPLLGALGNHGGATPTLPLLPASPAIDAGDDSACAGTDQRGVARPLGLTCDIGAFELIPRLSLARSDEGQVRLEYVFRAAQPSLISASTNLVDWLPLGEAVTDQKGRLEFEDAASNQFQLRFYRVRSN